MLNDLLTYTDYRQYLKDYYHWRKEKDAFFSYRYFGKKISLDSGSLVKILNRSMHLSPKKIPELVHFLQLKGRDAEYLETLILFNRATRTSEIKVLWEKLGALGGVRLRQVEDAQFEFYTEWYYTAIREWIGHHQWKGDLALLARSLRPRISMKKAGEAFELLKRLMLIRKNEDGFWEQSEAFITSAGNLHKKAVRKFQTDTMKLAAEALEKVPPEERNISTLSLSISQEDLPEINERIAEFRRSLMHLASESENPDVVYQLNVQLFPTSSGGQSE